MNKENIREYYEDIFQEMLAQMLPRLDRTLIRPSYQADGGYAAKNEINENYDDGVSGFDSIDNVIYFRVKFAPGSIGPEIDEQGNINTVNIIELLINVYGKNSSNIALEIFSKINADDIRFFINSNDIFLLQSPKSIDESREIINMQTWERHDLTAIYNVCEEIENLNKNIEAKGIDVINVR